MWYNTKLAEYRVLYEDSSEDHITLDMSQIQELQQERTLFAQVL